MNKKEIIEQLQSIKENAQTNIEGFEEVFPNEPNVWKMDVEVIDLVLNLIETLSKKCVDIYKLHHAKTLGEYNELMDHYRSKDFKLTEEEYKSIKEWIKNDN